MVIIYVLKRNIVCTVDQCNSGNYILQKYFFYPISYTYLNAYFESQIKEIINLQYNGRSIIRIKLSRLP